MPPERLHDTVPDAPLDPVSLYCVRELFADGYTNPEIPLVVCAIKKRKTVKRQSFSATARFFCMRTAFIHIPKGMLNSKTLSSLGSTTVNDCPALGGAHTLPEPLRPLLLEIAFLRCCFRHRTCSLSDNLDREVL
jgi:hypothetical protein